MKIKLTEAYKRIVGDKIPSYATIGSCGVDMYACIDEPVTLTRGQSRLIPSGVHFDIMSSMNNVVGVLVPRSSTGSKGYSLANTIGVIDSDYTGEVLMNIQNTSLESITIEPGMRLAQVIFMPVLKPRFVELTDEEELTITQRGAGGFGSTGK